MILVTAATAPVGRSIVEQLAEAATPVRALTRDPDKAGLPATAEVVAGDLGNPDSLATAFQGVDAVFLLAAVPGFAPAFVEAAREAGVRRIVFQSTGEIVDGAEPQPNAIAEFHREIEREIEQSGLEWTFLRLDVSSADALQWAFDVPGQLAQGDVVRGPYADAAGSPIHPADFAAVAIAALTRPEHANQVYQVTGPHSLTHREQIELIGAEHGRKLTFHQLTKAEAEQAISPYAPGEVLFATWERHVGQPAPVTDVIERLTGRPGRSAREWARAYPI
jgi:uncharacterized protein YbjT (DUF2867 family)